MSILKGKYTDSQAQFLTKKLPECYSLQQFIQQQERAFRQRKLKKIDDIYTTDFSLRVLKHKTTEKDKQKQFKEKQAQKLNKPDPETQLKKIQIAKSSAKIATTQKITAQRGKNIQVQTPSPIKQTSSGRQRKQPKSYQKLLEESEIRNKTKKSQPKILSKAQQSMQKIEEQIKPHSQQKNQDYKKSMSHSEKHLQGQVQEQHKMVDESQHQNQNNQNSQEKNSLQHNQYKGEMIGTVKTGKWEDKCNEILQKLRIHKSSWPFRRPVDPIAQGVPNYLQIVKEPMDLKTVQKNLKNNFYSNESQFNADIKKIFQSSYLFNPKHSIFFLHTVDFQKYYQQLVKEYQNYPNHLNIKQKQKRKEEEFDEEEFSKGSSKKQATLALKNKKSSKKEDQNQNESSPQNINISQSKKNSSQKKDTGKKQTIIEKVQNIQKNINQSSIIQKKVEVQKPVKKHSILTPTKKDLPISTIQKQKLFYRISLLSNQDLEDMLKLINGDKYTQYQEKQQVQLDLKDMTLDQIIQLKKFVYEKTKEAYKQQMSEESKDERQRVVADADVDADDVE